MSLSIANNSKNNLSITNDSKPSGQTWADMTIAWQDATSPWSQAGTPITRDSKNTITITNNSKS